MLFRGTLVSCTVNHRTLLIEAVRREAKSMVLFHNHPSGDPTASENDITLTQRAKWAGEAVGVELVDHLILAGKKWESLRRKIPELFGVGGAGQEMGKGGRYAG